MIVIIVSPKIQENVFISQSQDGLNSRNFPHRFTNFSLRQNILIFQKNWENKTSWLEIQRSFINLSYPRILNY